MCASLGKAFARERAIFSNECRNNLWSPRAGNIKTALVSTHSEERCPEYPTKTHAEAFCYLRKSLGAHANSLHSIDIDGMEYRNKKFIVVGTDTGKFLGFSFTGMNTRKK